MGWNTTRNLRFYSKNNDIGSINIESIIEEISNTARSLCSEIVYSKNDHENCYDLKFNSSKLSGRLIFNRATTEVWDLLSFEDGPTQIGNITEMTGFDNSYYETALFTFDEIILKGEQKQLESICKEFFPEKKHVNPHIKKIDSDTEFSLKLTGLYKANNQHDTGNNKRRQKTKKTSSLVSDSEFQGYFTVDNLFEEIIRVESDLSKLREFLQYLEEFENENPFEGLERISFRYKGQNVKEVQWIEWENQYTDRKRTYWNYCSGDGFRNCINPKWSEFSANGNC